MLCPTCGTSVPARDDRAAATRCPACGGALADEAPVEQVQQVERALVVRRQPEASVTVFARVSALPALAWRQPVVRSVVKTSAGAMALALVARTARRWLAATQSGRATTPGERLLPALGEALGSPQHQPPAQRKRGPDEGTVVVETFIYARRVIRRDG